MTMIENGKREREIAALVSLLDDSDDAILPVVTERLKSLKPNISALLTLRKTYSDNDVMSYRIGKIINEIRSSNLLWEIELWQQERDPELLKGLWLVYRALFPQAQYRTMADICMEMAKEVWVEITDNQTALEKVHLYNHIFLHRFGFKVDDPLLFEFEGAFLENALVKRNANPVLFGLIYLDVAYRVGLPIRAVVFPGGFMPVCVDENETILFYINIFNTGEIFKVEQLISLLREFGIIIHRDHFFIGNAILLSSIYAESLYYISGNKGNSEIEQKMEQIIKLLGDKRFLLIEEDDE